MQKSNSIFFGHGLSEPIGLEYIAGSLSAHGFEFRFCSRQELEVSIPNFEHKISLFSATTAEWNNMLALNNEAKKRGNITIIGGYHISGTYKINTNLPFDYAVIGEGEEIITDLLSEIVETNNNTGKKYYFAKQVEDISLLPFPYRSEEFLREYKMADLHWPPASAQINTAIMLGSRGCHNHCSFCASASMWGNGIRLRETENIIDELKGLKARFGTNNIVFVDQSLGQVKSWTEELCHKMIENKLDVNWYLQTNLSIDRSLIPLMAEAGCTKIGFGIEGVSPLAARKIKPVHKKGLEELNELVQLSNEHGIFVKAYLILGHPMETREMIEEYYFWLPKMKVNSIKFSFYTLFPGTNDWDKYKDRLVTKDWDCFDLVQMPVVRNPEISVDEYRKIRTELFYTFYTSPEFYETSKKMIAQYPNRSRSYLEFYPFLKGNEMLPRDMQLMDWMPELVMNKNQQCATIIN